MAVTESSQLSRVIVKKKNLKSQRDARELRGKVVTESSQLSRVVVKKKKLKSQIEKQESGGQRELVLLFADFSGFFWFC